MMKALIRGNEVMIEPFSPWVQNNIPFLTGTERDDDGNPIKGDGWTLVENYVPETDTAEDTPVDVPQTVQAIEDTAPDTIGETVEIGGRTYSLEELKKLIQ